VTRKPKIESFIVGDGVARGEKLQWIVDGGKFKASFLLPDEDGDDAESHGGLLISETVVPGFEVCDHDFLTEEGLEELCGTEQKGALEWLLLKHAEAGPEAEARSRGKEVGVGNVA
jgi:uncharacterized protein